MSALGLTPIWGYAVVGLIRRVPPFGMTSTIYVLLLTAIGTCGQAIWYTWVYVNCLTIYLVGTVYVRENLIYSMYVNKFPAIYLPSWLWSSGTMRGGTVRYTSKVLGQWKLRVKSLKLTATCRTSADHKVTPQLRDKIWSIAMLFGDLVWKMHDSWLVYYGESIFIDEHYTKQGIMYKYKK